MITAENIQELLTYNPESGQFFWKSTGERADKRYKYNGYCHIFYEKKLYLAHRLAWLFTHGKAPVAELDHINGVRHDNRIANLREATKSQNQCNGNRGKGYYKNGNKWRSMIKVNGKSIYLGTFTNEQDAVTAYRNARVKYFGEFA